MAEVYGPPNAVAGLIAYFRAHGVDARTRVPNPRANGMVRVTRVGGFPENQFQDKPRLLVEVWEADQAASFELACRLWGLVAVIDSQDALPGMVTHKIMPSTMPTQSVDDDAPDMDRHLFEVDAFMGMQPMEVDL